MIYKLITTQKAKVDFKNITEYIAQDNPQKAVSFIREIKEYLIQRLSTYPLSAKVIGGQIRMLPYKRYVILYVVDEQEKIVRILKIFAGGQDWEAIIRRLYR